jgi:DNA repair photolyase
MDEKLSVKSNALEVLEKQLKNRAKKEQYGFIVLSSATDPYLQIEKETLLTRNILELIAHYKFPVHVITKSDLVIRDLDILKRINKNSILPPDLEGKLTQKALITFSFSTLDSSIGKLFEPGATPPERRLETLKRVIAEGFYSGVSLMPLIPLITDTRDQLEFMFKNFKEAGTKYIFPASITLFGNGPADSQTLMFRVVSKHYPHLSEKFEKLFRYGFQISSSYRKELQAATDELALKHGLPTRIVIGDQ